MNANGYEIRFQSLYQEGRALCFPCDEDGQVEIDRLSERARDNYFYARAAGLVRRNASDGFGRKRRNGFALVPCPFECGGPSRSLVARCVAACRLPKGQVEPVASRRCAALL